MLEKIEKIYNQRDEEGGVGALKVEIPEEEFKTILTYSVGIE